MLYGCVDVNIHYNNTYIVNNIIMYSKKFNEQTIAIWKLLL